jgi:hypothetical protein
MIPRSDKIFPTATQANHANRVVGTQPCTSTLSWEIGHFTKPLQLAKLDEKKIVYRLVDVTNCYREEPLPICVGGERHAEDGYCENKPNSGNRIIGPAFMPAWSHCKRFADVDSWSRETRNATVTWLVPVIQGFIANPNLWSPMAVAFSESGEGTPRVAGREGRTEVAICRPQSKNRSKKNFPSPYWPHLVRRDFCIDGTIFAKPRLSFDGTGSRFEILL